MTDIMAVRNGTDVASGYVFHLGRDEARWLFDFFDATVPHPLLEDDISYPEAYETAREMKTKLLKALKEKA